MNGEVADDRVTVALGSVGALVDPLLRPVLPEERAARGEFGQQAGQFPVVGIPSGVHPQHGGGVRGGGVPVRVQFARRGVEEEEAGLVALVRRPRVEVGDQRAGERVGGHHVRAPAQDERRAVRGVERGQQSANRLADGLAGHPAAVAGSDGALMGQIEQVRVFGVVQSQRGRQRLQHLGRRGPATALLEPGVVVDAHAGQLGEFLAAQARHPPPGADGHARVGGRHPAAARAQKLSQLHDLVHAAILRRARRGEKARG